jgi:pimeloyl-ACP methyl ester carboxylesterase
MAADKDDLVLEVLRPIVPDLTRGELRRDGGTLSWIASSPRPVTVILDAGSCATLLTWAPVLADLSADYRVIAYERAGYGRSDRAPLLTLGAQVDDLVSLLTCSGDGPLIVVGHSWGGLLAQLASWKVPSAIAGLVLIDPSHEEVWADESASVAGPPIAPGSANWASELSDLRVELALDARELAHRIRGDSRLQDRWVAAQLSYLATEDQARIWFDEFPMMIGSIEEIRARRAIAAYIEAPIELITVSKGPQDIQKVERHAALIGSLGDVHHLVVTDSKHNIQEARPALVVDSVRRVAHRAGV